MIDSIARWLRPRTEEDRWRTASINLAIATVNICVVIVCVVAAFAIQWARHQ